MKALGFKCKNPVIMTQFIKDCEELYDLEFYEEDNEINKCCAKFDENCYTLNLLSKRFYKEHKESLEYADLRIKTYNLNTHKGYKKALKALRRRLIRLRYFLEWEVKLKKNIIQIGCKFISYKVYKEIYDLVKSGVQVHYGCYEINYKNIELLNDIIKDLKSKK